jgi:hypothetical protein
MLSIFSKGICKPRVPHAGPRISYFVVLATATCAALPKESRMKLIDATDLDRKSGHP